MTTTTTIRARAGERAVQWRAYAALILAAACWGLATVMSKRALLHVPPLTLLVVQLTASLAMLWSGVAWQRCRAGAVAASPLPGRRELPLLALAGFLEPGLANLFGLIGLALITASLSALIWAAEPILILGLSALLLRERLTRPMLALAAVAIAGVVLVVGVDLSAAGPGLLLGSAITLVGVFCCALYVVLTRHALFTRRGLDRVEAVLLVAVQQSAALLFVLLLWPVALWRGELAGLAAIPPGEWAWAAASGVVYYALAFWFYVAGLRHTPAGLAGLFFNLVPVFGVGGAYLFLGERLSAGQWLGAALILGAVVALMRGTAEPSAAPAADQS